MANCAVVANDRLPKPAKITIDLEMRVGQAVQTGISPPVCGEFGAVWKEDPEDSQSLADRWATLFLQYLEKRDEIDKLYRHAAEKWKKGKEAIFPVGTYPPGRAKPVDQLEARAPPN